MNPSKNLIYTIAIDLPDQPKHCRRMAQLLVSSLIKCGTECDIIVITGGGPELFHCHAEGYREIAVEPTEKEGWTIPQALRWKMKARELFDATEYDKILYLDCDILAFKNPDDLLQGTWDLMAAKEMGRDMLGPAFASYFTQEELDQCQRAALNSGTFMISGKYFYALMEAWDETMDQPPLTSLWREGADQPAWNRLFYRIEEGKLELTGELKITASYLPVETVCFPFLKKPDLNDYMNSTFVHYAGGEHPMRVERMLEEYFQMFYMGEPVTNQ